MTATATPTTTPAAPDVDVDIAIEVRADRPVRRSRRRQRIGLALALAVPFLCSVQLSEFANTVMVQIAIAINIRKGATTRIQISATDAGLQGDVFEMPIAQIAEQLVAASQTAKVKIAPTVAIDIARRDTRAIQQNLVG